MKSYYTVKKLSKSLVLLSLLAVLISGGSFFISKAKVGADVAGKEITDPNKEFYIVYKNDTEFDIYAKNVSVQGTPNPLTDAISEVKNNTCSKLDATSCYGLFSGYPWDNTKVDSNKIDWLFLKQVYIMANSRGNEPAKKAIRHAISNYAKGDRNVAVANNRETFVYGSETFAKNISAPALKQQDNLTPNLSYKSEFLCTIVEAEQCWIYNESVNGAIPSVDDPMTPDWAFVSRVNNKLKDGGDERIAKAFQPVYNRFIADAWAMWDQVDLKHLKDKYLAINSQNFLDALTKYDSGSLNATDPYWSIKPVEGAVSSDQFVLKLEDSYPEATENSVWLKGMQFVLGSVIPKWTELGLDLNEEKSFLTTHMESFLSYAKRKENPGKNGIIKFTVPEQIMLAEPGDNFKFSVGIDKSKLSSDANARYDVKLYVKPESKKSANPAV